MPFTVHEVVRNLRIRQTLIAAVVVALGLGDDRGEAHGQCAVRGVVAHLVMLRHPRHPFSEQRASLQSMLLTCKFAWSMEIRRAYHLVGVLEAVQARDRVRELVLDVDAGGCEAGVGREAGGPAHQAAPDGLQPGSAVVADAAGHAIAWMGDGRHHRDLDEEIIDGCARVDDEPWPAGRVDVGGFEGDSEMAVDGRGDVRRSHLLRRDAAALAVGAADCPAV